MFYVWLVFFVLLVAIATNPKTPVDLVLNVQVAIITILFCVIFGGLVADAFD